MNSDQITTRDIEIGFGFIFLCKYEDLDKNVVYVCYSE